MMCQIFHHRWFREVLEEEKKSCHVFPRPSQTFWHSSLGANFIFRLCRDAIKETNRLMGRSVRLQGVPSGHTQHTRIFGTSVSRSLIVLYHVDS